MKNLWTAGFVLIVALAAPACSDNDPANPSPTGPPKFKAQLLQSNEMPAIANADAAATGTLTITLNVTRDAATTSRRRPPISYHCDRIPRQHDVDRRAHSPGAARSRRERHRSVALTASDSCSVDRSGDNHEDRYHHRPGGRSEHHQRSDRLLLQRAHNGECRRRYTRTAGEAIATNLSICVSGLSPRPDVASESALNSRSMIQSPASARRSGVGRASSASFVRDRGGPLALPDARKE